MKLLVAAAMILCAYTGFSQSTYEKAWTSINNNKRAEAESLLLQVKPGDTDFADAYMTLLFLKEYSGREKSITDFSQAFVPSVKDPYPYIYALWFDPPVLGPYGKKTLAHQVKLMDQLCKDENAPGTIVAAANYQKGMNSVYSNEIEKSQKYYDQLGNIKTWQYVGPFENLSQSGIYKNFGPLDHPEATAVFKSLTNADISWFTPATEIRDGWTPMIYQFNRQTAVVYAQNFVSSDKDQTVICAVGVSGAIKVWVNDELVVSEVKERVTELDTYNVQCHLNKGTNRVLVELGYTSQSYPNFSLRFTDDKLRAISGITGSASFAAYTKVQTQSALPALIPPFAETYFKAQLAANPKNLVNYLLLADVYLRNKKIAEARNLMSEAMIISPDNSLLRMKLVEVLLKDENKTVMQEEVEKIKVSDPESLLVIEIKLKELINDDKYEDAEALLQKRISLFGEDETTEAYKIMFLNHEKKYDELVKEAEKMYAKTPDNARMIEMMYTIKKEVYKDNKGALKIYDNFVKDNYDFSVFTAYAKKLEEAGNNEKARDVRENLANDFPYGPDGYSNLAQYYYGIKKLDKAGDNIKKALSLSPYNEDYWEQLGDIENEKKSTTNALDAYNKSLQFNPNQYDILNKIRKLNGKKEMYKIFPETDFDKVIKEDKNTEPINTDYGYYYILDQKDVIVYPGGANQEYYTLVIKITSDKGVDAYKESTIGYGSSQNLLIEKAEIRKSNQSKIEGERNDNQIVFTNLEVGDVIVFKYRLQSYVYGRFEKEYWDKFVFGGLVYTAASKYNLVMPASQKINYEFSNSSLKPTIRDIENFKEYSWEILHAEPLKSEPLMPKVIDVGTVLHLSTIDKWSDISGWYSDVVNNKAEEDFEIIALYNKLFPATLKGLTQFKKAKIIYEYIQANIRYSSVSFRQSAFVPQRPSATLTTRLGDCKDLSSLFVTLAHMAGISAQMVLVDTRDNGQKEMLLPSLEFNHCIAKVVLDKKSYYIELTNNYLPFASLPNNLNGAAILEIPSNSIKDNADIQYLATTARTRDRVKRIIDIKPTESDLDVMVKTVKYGSQSAGTREDYANLNNKKQLEELEKNTANGYKNNLKMQQVSFKDLDKLDDSVTYSYNYKVKNEVSEIGSLNTFKIVYPDVIASLDKFSSDTREYPIEYWSYEDVDSYETIVNIAAPAGKKFVELPLSQSFEFKDLKFQIHYTLKSPDKLVITKTFSNTRQQEIAPADYPAFKSFFEKIVKAEQKFIAYK